MLFILMDFFTAFMSSEVLIDRESKTLSPSALSVRISLPLEVDVGLLFQKTVYFKDTAT